MNMGVIYIEVSDRDCPYCRKKITPKLVKYKNERRLICPRCNLTIEVVSNGE